SSVRGRIRSASGCSSAEVSGCGKDENKLIPVSVAQVLVRFSLAISSLTIRILPLCAPCPLWSTLLLFLLLLFFFSCSSFLLFLAFFFFFFFSSSFLPLSSLCPLW